MATVRATLAKCPCRLTRTTPKWPSEAPRPAETTRHKHLPVGISDLEWPVVLQQTTRQHAAHEGLGLGTLDPGAAAANWPRGTPRGEAATRSGAARPGSSEPPRGEPASGGIAGTQRGHLASGEASRNFCEPGASG